MFDASKQHVVFIGYVWPEPDSSAAGYRTLGLIESFLKNNYQVSFICAAQINEFSSDLSSLHVNCHQIKLNDSHFEELISTLLPDIVVYDRFITEEQYAWRVEKVSPQALKILDTCDLHFLRRARQSSLQSTLSIGHQTSSDNYLSQINHLDLQSENAIREVAAILRCDLSLIISSFEMKLLTTNFDISPEILLYLPFMLENSNHISPYSKRQHFVQIGNFLHPPNWDAVLWCKKSIWPLIRKQLPNAECHIYGAYSSDKVKQLHKPEQGFLIKGRAPQLSSVFEQYRVNLAPLRFGAGIKGKIADGFIHGLPCITTSIGAEGMSKNHEKNYSNDWGGEIHDNTEKFIQSAISTYTSQDNWEAAQLLGSAFIKKHHNKTQQQQIFIETTAKILLNLKQHRKNNFIGTMLNYHLHQRTKYLSRWIESKNSISQD